MRYVVTPRPATYRGITFATTAEAARAVALTAWGFSWEYQSALRDCGLTVSEAADLSPSIRRRHTSGVRGEPRAPAIGASSAERRLG